MRETLFCVCAQSGTKYNYEKKRPFISTSIYQGVDPHTHLLTRETVLFFYHTILYLLYKYIQPHYSMHFFPSVVLEQL